MTDTDLRRLAEAAIVRFDDDYGNDQGANARYIAAADPQTVLAKLDEIDTLERQVATLREAFDRLQDFVADTDAALLDAFWFTEHNTPQAIEARRATLTPTADSARGGTPDAVPDDAGNGEERAFNQSDWGQS